MLRLVESPREWEEFIATVNQNTFLHHQGWIDFNAKHGFKTWRWGWYEEEKLVSALFCMVVDAKRGRFLFVPHGPQSRTELDSLALQTWSEHLRNLARQEGCAFIRISPIAPDTPANRSLFQKAGYRKAPLHMHAELTTVVDLTPSKDDILLAMRKSTRQACRKGERLVESGEVTVEAPTSLTSEMYEVYADTAKRGGFVGFTREYIQDEYTAFQTETTSAHYRVVRYRGRILSWGLWILTPKRAFYHQGANMLHKKIPASYLSHWEGIKLAKTNGCQTYDFWGVAPLNQPNHPWQNISLFKRGFGGRDLALVPAQDLPLRPFYWVTWAVETLRAKKRGFRAD